MLVFETLVLSVAANVISHYICKWLDGWFSPRNEHISYNSLPKQTPKSLICHHSDPKLKIEIINGNSL